MRNLHLELSLIQYFLEDYYTLSSRVHRGSGGWTPIPY